MRKKRLIFALLYQDGFFVQSRNFRLQKVGDVNWLLKNYNFNNIAKAIDELAIINVSRDRLIKDNFFRDVEKLSRTCFMPKLFGGAITGLQDAKNLFNLGADKIILNSLMFNKPEIVQDLASHYGNQAIVGSFDFNKNKETNLYKFFSMNGNNQVTHSLSEVMKLVQTLGLGEAMFQSISLDGTGFGLDLEILNQIEKYDSKIKTPIIISGGAGNFEHIYQAMMHPIVNSVLTANLLNFMGESLKNTRSELILRGINLPKFI
jgi:cyclase